MKARITRENIVSTTIDLITRYGIRAVGVDEIASTLGISKRTLYEIFNDKTELIDTCIEEIGRRQQQSYLDYLKSHETGEESLENLIWITNRLIESLYQVDTSYLAEVCRKIEFQSAFLSGREFWKGTIDGLIRKCIANGYLNPETIDYPIALRMLTTFYAYRLDHVSLEELLTIARTFIRGMATKKGIDWIDGCLPGEVSPGESVAGL